MPLSLEFFADPSCRAAVLHGSEKAFAAGADIGEPIDAQRALTIGLVQEIVSNEQLLSRALDQTLALEAKR
ncbi:MAG: hypothetical protein HYY26_07710 [Acidobacteria bacterium]|nr:hypothetical protein [Acidobacteriota bacterium]